MKGLDNEGCDLAGGFGVTGDFKNTAPVWTSSEAVTNGTTAEEVQLTETKPATWPQLLAAVVVNLNVFALGSSMGWAAMALPQLLSSESGLRDRPITMEEGSWVASLPIWTTCVLVPVFTAASECMGRKMLGYVTITPLLVSWIIMMFSTSIEVLYAARVLGALQSAGCLTLSTLYVSETTSDEIRGRLGCMLPLLCNSGMVFAYVIGAYLSYQVVLYVNVAPAVIFIVCFAFMPETPYRLARLQQVQQAREALRWFRRGISEEQLEREMARIQASLRGDSKQGSDGRLSLRELCSRAPLLGFAILITLAINLQFCGSFTVLNYAVIIFNEAGGSVPSEVATIILGAMQVVGTMASSLLIDRVGRRPVLFLSNGFVGTCVAILGAYLYLKQETQVDLSSVGWLPVTCLAIYVLMTAFGLSPLPYVVLSEIVAPRIRGLASIVVLMMMTGASATLSKVYPAMSETMGAPGMFWFFSSVCLVCAFIGWWLLPETKGRPLEDILKDLNGGKDVIVITS